MPEYVIPHGAPYPRSALGWDGVDFRVISVDTLGRVIVASNPGPINLDVPYRETVTTLNAAVGVNVLYGPVVPADHVLVLTNCLGFDVNTNVTLVTFGIRLGASLTDIHTGYPVGAGQAIYWNGHVYLPAAYQVFVRFAGCVLNDDLFAYFHGHLHSLI